MGDKFFSYVNAILKKENSLEYYMKDFFENDDNFKNFNYFMLMKYFYMGNFISQVDILNKYIFHLDKPNLFKMMYLLIPKSYNFIKYIKKDKTVKNKILENIKNYFNCNKKIAKQYLEFLSFEDLDELLSKYGINEKERKKLLKDLK